MPLPYTLVCFFGLVLPFRTTKFLYTADLPKRRLDKLYVVTVTRGDNRGKVIINVLDAVLRSWESNKVLERVHPSVAVHVVTDEPYSFSEVNCFVCPRSFQCDAKHKARALEWYRKKMNLTEHDWVLHLDEESVIDPESLKAVLEFIWYEDKYLWGQGLIFYNQYRFWSNWFFTVADAIRVGDDLSRFALQYSYFHTPIFGAHGSFLLVNGRVENEVTWSIQSLTEDYQFATTASSLGYQCGKVPGIIREQSPMNLVAFLKQRRRWFVGIRRLEMILPKIWWTFWTLGTLSLYGTIASVILGTDIFILL